MFFEAWDRPAPLLRAWCVWELYGAARFRKTAGQVTLQVILTPIEATRFVDEGLIGDFDSIAASVATMQVRSAECFDKADKAMIDKAIAEEVPGGHTTLDEMVADQLQAWFTRAALEAVSARRGNEAFEPFTDLLSRTGSLSKDQGLLDKALATYEEALDIRRSNLGARHISVANTLDGMAIVYDRQGLLDKASATRAEAQDITRSNRARETHRDRSV